jgi:hypothetical protein
MRPVLAIVVLLAVSAPALADRHVWVNGRRMSDAEIAYLERLRCGRIPNGRYWLNPQTGIWGYWGNPHAQGHISDQCGGRAMNRRGPFGDYMSDGRCSFVNGVPVGQC